MNFIWHWRQRYKYSSTSLVVVRGFCDEIFWPTEPRTTEEPRTKEGHIKVDIDTKFELKLEGARQK